MKFNKIFGSLALAALLSAGLSSCSNDMEDYRVSGSTKAALVNKAPKILAYSGDHFWGQYSDVSGFTRADGSIVSVTKVTDDWNDIYTINQNEGPNNVISFLKWGLNGWVDLDLYPWIKEEWIIEKNSYNSWGNVNVPAGFAEGTTGHDAITKLNTDFGFKANAGESLTFYPYISGQTDQTHKEIGIFYYDSEGQIHKEIVWDSEVPGYNNGKIEGVTLTFNADCVFGLYFSGRTHSANSEDIYYYSIPELNEVSINADDASHRDIKVHAGLVPETLLNGFYSGTVMLIEDWDDFDFDDFMIFFKEKVTSTTSEEITNGSTTPPATDKCGQCGHDAHKPGPCPDCDDPEDGCYVAPDDNCELCDHPSHNPGHCDECGKFQGCNKPGSVTPPGGNFDPGFNVTPNTPPVVAGDDHTNEVEVNLAVDTKGETSNGKYNESHTSIHVRSAVDVDLFIPMPLEMICPADDMEIVKKHLTGEMAHGGEFQGQYEVDADGKAVMQGGLLSKMTYEIKDATTNRAWTVSIYVEYVGENGNTAHEVCPREFNGEGIHIWTEGLEGNTDLFDYLQETYGDGITFEIWNYYKEDADFAVLKGYLDQTTIDFIGNVLPDFFINAFGSENFEAEKDCNVNIVEDKAGNYEFKGEGPHLNASEHNKIYEKKNSNNNPTVNTGGGE